MGKFLNVDVLDTLHVIAKQIVINGWDDFADDKINITQAARYKPPGQCALVWICHSCGTSLYQESDTFVRGTAAYNDVQFYQSDERSERVPTYYEIVISGEQRGVVRGNVYALDSRRYAEFAKDAMPFCSTDAEIITARNMAVERARRIRMSLPNTSLDAHLKELIQEQINSEAKRITAIIQGMDIPNDPRGTYHIAAISNHFLAKASADDVDKLMAKLRDALQSPSLFWGGFGDKRIPCVFQHHTEHEKAKPSIRGQLAAAKEMLAERPNPQQHQKDKGAR